MHDLLLGDLDPLGGRLLWLMGLKELYLLEDLVGELLEVVVLLDLTLQLLDLVLELPDPVDELVLDLLLVLLIPAVLLVGKTAVLLVQLLVFEQRLLDFIVLRHNLLLHLLKPVALELVLLRLVLSLVQLSSQLALLMP